MNTSEITKRYTILSQDTCCLSCGGAADKSEPKPGEVCIDLGSGRGNDVIRIAEIVGDKGFVYGVDVTPEMISKSESTALKLGVENVKFIHSDLEQINLPDNLANLIISNCTLNHVGNKYKVWREIYRMLKNGGRFVISDIYSLDVIPEEFANDPAAVAECWAGAITKKEYFDVMKSAGFKNVEILEESQPYAKGKVEVVSFTIRGEKNEFTCCG